MTSFRRQTVTVLSLCWLAGCGGGPAAPATQGDGAAVIAEFAAFYAPATAWSVTSRLEMKLLDPAGNEMPEYDRFEQTRTIILDGPQRFAIRSADGLAALCDGEHSFVAIEPDRRYWRTAPLNKPAAVLESPVAPMLGGPEHLKLLLLSGDDPVLAIKAAHETSTYLGVETLDGRPAHRLQVTAGSQGSLTSSATTDIWIAAEGDPLLLQVQRTNPPGPMQLSEDTTIEAGVVTTQTFTDWDFQPELSNATFRPAADLRRVASLQNLFEPPPPLLGEAAPEIDLVPLEGEIQPLSDLRGKVVLLDFWASWCGPCRIELPILAKLEQEYAEQGVVLYAVNLGETAGQIQGILRRELADVKPALDSDGSIAAKFGVNGIPHLAIIGPDGRVQAVHIGVGDDTEAVLREEIEALLAGVSLVDDGLPE